MGFERQWPLSPLVFPVILYYLGSSFLEAQMEHV